MKVVLLLLVLGVVCQGQQEPPKLHARYTSLDYEPNEPAPYRRPQPQGQDQYRHGPQQQQPQRHKQAQKEVALTSSEEAELQELEDEGKPDRLTELLKESKFACGGKKDGYYADDTLNCEVFHYCQEGAKHSWVCPESFAFHQIHLICVPASSSDNMCQKSSDFHFVNDYLYKPVNEAQARQYNSSLKYADRYYPENYGGESGNRELLEYNNNRGTGNYFSGESGEDLPPPRPTQQSSYSRPRQTQAPQHRQHQPQSSYPGERSEYPRREREEHSFPPPQQHVQRQQAKPFPSPQPQHNLKLTNAAYPSIPSYPRQHQVASVVQPKQYIQHSQPQAQQSVPKQQQPQQQPQPRQQHGQVYTSPSEINIPLSARRPAPSNKNFNPSPQFY